MLCVTLIWLAAPLIKPAHSDLTAVYQPPNNPLSSPALAPYIPAQTSAVAENSGDQPLMIDPSTPAVLIDDTVERQGSSNWRVISYAETKAFAANNRALADSTLSLSIPALGIDAPIIPVSLETKQSESRRLYQQWSVPDSYAAGWHEDSAPPGQTGNTVLNGHNNIHGAVFANLVDLNLGEQIILRKGVHEYIYEVVHREFLPEKGESLRTRLWNARWIAPSDDARLTIVTCWPNTSNSHRLVVIAQPVSPEPGY